MKRKWLAIVIILLFVGIAYAPVINAIDESRMPKALSIPKKEDTVSITVLEYKADGTVEKSVVEMACQQVNELRSELSSIKNLDTRLSIYKKYGFISQDITAMKLRMGMEEKAKRMGLMIERVKQQNIENLFNKGDKSFLKLSKFFYVNFLCSIHGSGHYLVIPFGTTTFQYLNYLFNPGYVIQSIDIRDTFIGGFDITTHSFLCEVFPNFPNLFPDSTNSCSGVMKIIGFTGFMFYGYSQEPKPYHWNIFEGFAVYVRLLGVVS